MSRRGRRILFVLLSAVVLTFAQYPTPPPTRQLKFNTVTTPWNEPISLDYHEPSDTVISSASFGVESSTNYNFGRIDSAGNWYAYSTIAGVPGELNMATVPPKNIYPGPFVSGDIFGGNNNYLGTILRVTTGGQAILNWCTLPGAKETFAFGGFYVDRTGLWDYHLIGITGNSAGNTIGEVWKIDPNCANPVKLTEVHDWCEGIIVVPNNATRWGPIAGAILLGCEQSTKLIAIKPNNGGTVSWVTGADQVSTDDLDLIQPGQNWFGMSWTSGKYIGVSWDQWVGYEGYILASTHGTGLNIIWWNFQTNAPGWTRLTSEAGSPYQPGTLWEQSSFTPSGISEILPFSYSLCVLPQINGVNQTWGPSGPMPVKLTTASAIGNYQYSISTPYSSSATLIPPVQGAIIMYFTQDAQNVFSLTATVASSAAGSLTLSVISTGLGSPSVVVQDDPATTQSGASGDFPDTTFWQNGQGSFTWSWGAGRTDGFVLAPLSFISPPNNQAFQINIKVTSHSSNIQNWYFYSANSSLYYSVGIDNSLSLIRVSCTCGNDKTDPYEECDAGPSGDGCCTSDCKFRSLNQLCPQNLVGNCDTEDTPAATDRCTGYNVACDVLTTCTDCALAAQCGWCCSTQSCVAGNSTNPPTAATCPVFQYHTCGCAHTCVHGTCQCTNCSCQPSWGGPSCDMVVGCDGNLYPEGDPSIPIVDVCNVCNGNGTSCLGCDGIPYGAVNDSCGVCGGDGSTCYSWCTDHTSCDSCLGTEGCIWCASAKVCQQSGYRYLTDCDKWINDCSDNFWDNLSPAVKGVSAGVLAAIIIAGAVGVGILAFGGKKGYELLVNTKMPTEGVMVSPLYEDSNMKGTNPMYREPDNDKL